MPPKRKADPSFSSASSSSSSAGGITDSGSKDGNNPRRSRRISQKTMDSMARHAQHERIASVQLRGTDNVPISKDGRSPRQKAKEGEPGVQTAIQSLAEMERKLRKDTKRQKLRLQESSIPVRHELPVEETGGAIPATGLDTGGRELTPTTVGRMPTVDEVEEQGTKCGSDDGNDSDFDPADEGAKSDDANTNFANEAMERGAARPPAVNSSYLPLPWKGRLGYACLNTYLRTAHPPVFSSRTCRMASIVSHRHPLEDPSLPEHPRLNKPDRSRTPDSALGDKFVQELGLANARDIVKMIQWNDKYGIKFMRLSSDMFPFASHLELGYKLAPFASDVLAEAGKVIAELGHRVTTHPGQFTQLGSPRHEVVTAAIRDLEYHHEMLSLLKLPPQQDRDAVMILHMGGTYGDKAATLDRFRHNYTTLLSEGVKARLVLENDDVAWAVHDLLPICEELDIPLVLDYHHHNIIFDAEQVREGTLDISEPALMARISATWTRKGIRQKMHYSEARPGAVTPRDRRRHANRVMTLPPCPPDADLMIEAKDKEQAVFELMRTFRLPGFEKINDMVPYEREDEDRPLKQVPKRGKRKRAGKAEDLDENGNEDDAVAAAATIPSEDLAMGGPQNRVYWPVGMEEWLKPKKREVAKAKKRSHVSD